MKTFKIVLVEDNPGDVVLVRIALKTAGLQFELDRYGDGAAAANAISALTEPPDLILLDLNLPRLDGLQLLTIIRSLPPLANVPTAILTSAETERHKQEAERLGATAFIIKPYGFDEFMQGVGGAIRELLLGQRLG